MPAQTARDAEIRPVNHTIIHLLSTNNQNAGAVGEIDSLPIHGQVKFVLIKHHYWRIFWLRHVPNNIDMGRLKQSINDIR